MKVFEAVAETLAGLGHLTAFGLLGSGNFKLPSTTWTAAEGGSCGSATSRRR